MVEYGCPGCLSTLPIGPTTDERPILVSVSPIGALFDSDMSGGGVRSRAGSGIALDPGVTWLRIGSFAAESRGGASSSSVCRRLANCRGDPGGGGLRAGGGVGSRGAPMIASSGEAIPTGLGSTSAPAGSVDTWGRCLYSWLWRASSAAAEVRSGAESADKFKNEPC